MARPRPHAGQGMLASSQVLARSGTSIRLASPGRSRYAFSRTGSVPVSIALPRRTPPSFLGGSYPPSPPADKAPPRFHPLPAILLMIIERADPQPCPSAHKWDLSPGALPGQAPHDLQTERTALACLPSTSGHASQLRLTRRFRLLSRYSPAIINASVPGTEVPCGNRKVTASGKLRAELRELCARITQELGRLMV